METSASLPLGSLPLPTGAAATADEQIITRKLVIKNMFRLLRRMIVACASAGLATLILCLGNGCALQSNPQQTNPAASSARDSFTLADANHDGKLSREEAGDYLVYVVFAVCDKERDGRLTQEEWMRGDSKQISAFKLRDANEDGVVTMEEAIVYGRRGGAGLALMRRADKNRDGKLDRAEIEAYSASLEGSPR